MPVAPAARCRRTSTKTHSRWIRAHAGAAAILIHLENPNDDVTGLLVLFLAAGVAQSMTPQDLARAAGARIDRATEFFPAIRAAMAEFDINTPARQAAFLAQIGHESGGLHWTVEIWGPTSAQLRYEGRKDLGNTQPGDGYKFKGRGLIQTTGRANYAATGAALGVELVYHPELLAEPELAARSAAWYWQSRGLNELADVGDFRRITLRVNGGLNGLADRLALWDAAKATLA